jgi:transcription elongation factor GreA-like protein
MNPWRNWWESAKMKMKKEVLSKTVNKNEERIHENCGFLLGCLQHFNP